MEKCQHVRVGVAVVVKRKRDGKMVVGRRTGQGIQHGLGCYQVPGGHLEYGEEIMECAWREVFEETGLTLDKASMKVMGLTNDFFETEGKHYITVFVEGFREEHEDAMKEEIEPRAMEPEKCDQWNWYAWEEVEKLEPLFLGLKKLVAGKVYPVDKIIG